jgi:hypothetical protein
VDVEKLLETAAEADISDVPDKIDVIITIKNAFVNDNDVFLNEWNCVVTYLCFHKYTCLW